jgi:hypothetical protein
MMKKNITKQEVKKKKVWSKPVVKNIGNAKELVANVNVQGLGDTQFSVLEPS